MKRWCAATLALLMTATFAMAAGPKPPLFTAFKTFCIDTGADFPAVAAALARAGAKQEGASGLPDEIGLRNSAVPPRHATWELMWSGVRLDVQAGTTWPRLKTKSPQNDTVRDECQVWTLAEDEASTNAARAWAGVPPQRPSEQDQILLPRHQEFEFQVIGSTHMGIVNEAERQRAIAEGRRWRLSVRQGAEITSLDLEHERGDSAALLATARAVQPVVTSPTDISRERAVEIAKHACGHDLSFVPENGWGARREGTEWRVWSPATPDPDDDAWMPVFQVWLEAKSGEVRTCRETIIEYAQVKLFIVFFALGESNLDAQARMLIAEAVKTAKRNGWDRVSITGHTDSIGSDARNLALGQARAQAVKDEMVRLGMDGSKIRVASTGMRDPLVESGSGRREPQNRRAVIDLDR